MPAARSTRSRSTARIYSLQRPDSFARWYDETPGGFCLRRQGPRFITHIRRLREIETPLANFFASGVLRLEEKLGPVLWQFPPSFRFSAERLDHFFSLLPRDTEAAAALAEHRSEWLAGRAWARTERRRELRHAIEIRHQSFLDPAFIALLRRHRVAFVFANSVAWPYAEDVTADFVYLRLHGSEELYASGYSDEALDHWAARIKLWAQGLEPNDARLIAPDAEPAPAKPPRCLRLFRQRRQGPGAGRRALAARQSWPEIPCSTGKIRRQIDRFCRLFRYQLEPGLSTPGRFRR